MERDAERIEQAGPFGAGSVGRGGGGLARFVLRRLALFPPTLVGITLVVFLVIHAAPGDPASLYASGESESAPGGAVEAARDRFRAEHLLDRPLWLQYLHYLGPFDLSPRGATWAGGSGEHPYGGVLALDLGREFRRPDVPVAEELGRRLRVTVPLSLAALLVAYGLGIPLGIACALRQGRAFDRGASTALAALYSVPTFWAGLLLVIAFGATGLGWLPVIGLHSKDAAGLSAGGKLLDLARHAVLPVATLSLTGLVVIARQMRSGMIETLRADFVRAARAKGLSERSVVLGHALRNALFPIVTLSASVLPALVSGALVVETVFQIPGIGRYAYEGLLARDYNVVMATTLIAAVMTLAGLLLADLLYALLDPRVRHG